MEVKDIVASKDVRMVTLQRKIESAKSPEERERFEKEKFELLQGREQVIKSMREIVSKCTNSNEEVERIMHGKSHAYTTREYKEVAEYYKVKCFNWHEAKYQSAMEHLYLFSNLLEEKVTVERIKNAIDEVGAAIKAEKKKEAEQSKEIEQEKIQVMDVKDIVASKDVRIVTLQRKIESAKSPEERERFEKEKFELLQGREQVIKSMREIVSKCTNSNEEVERIMHGKSHAYTTREYKEVAEYYKVKCFNWHEAKYQSAMEHLYLFSNLLEEKVTVERIKNAIDEVGAAIKAEKKKEAEQSKEIEQEKIQVMEVKDIVASKDVRIVTLQRKIESAKSPEERERFEKEKFELLQGREQVIKSMREIVSKCTNSNEEVERIMHGKSHAYTTREYKEVAEYYKVKCFNWHEAKYQSAMEHLYLFSNLIEEKVTVERIKNAIDEVGAAIKAEKKKEAEQSKEIEQEKM